MKDSKNNPQKPNFWQRFSNGKSEGSTKKLSKRSHIPFRLNFLFFVIFALFVALIVQLGYLQLVNGDYIKKQIASSSTVTVQQSTPRGLIYDSSGKALVGNKANQAVTFTRGSNVSSATMYKLAAEVSKLIDVPADKLTERDKKDYWLANPDNLEAANKKLTAKEKTLSTSDQYAALVKKVSADAIQFDEATMKIATIFTRMNGATALNTVFIKNENVTDDEIAVIAEHTADLPGISTGTDWTREYTSADDSLRSILGTVSTEKQGLPAEEAAAYLAKGYSSNDRVGTSWLEKQYESVLQGTKSKSEVSLDANGDITSQKEVFEGSKGSNVMLTINAEFQQKVEDILKKDYQSLIDAGYANYSPGAYVVVMDPKTGAVLAMSGFKHEAETNKLTEDALGTFVNAYVPGSVVKAGTLTAGYQTGVITGNDVLIDEPIKLLDTPIKGSIYNKTILGNQMSLDAVTALEVSSNAYMMKVVLKILGVPYKENMSLPASSESKAMFDKLRNAFAEFGMGTTTGLDMPQESTGIKNEEFGSGDSSPKGGNLLDLSFGQYDTYTPMQLAQYVSTVANGGTRHAAHLVSGIYGNDENGELGALEKAITPQTLNTVDITDEQMKLIQQGFYEAVHGSNSLATATALQAAKMTVSAKTGTAETSVTIDGTTYNTINSNLVAYGPSDDAKVAVAVMLPNLQPLNSHDTMNRQIALEVLNAYYDQFMQ